MQKRHIILTTMTALALTAAAQSWPTAGLEAKAGARWWWMGSAVNEADLRWNMQQYAQAGIGSLEITPLYGVQGNQANELSFLSAPWMKALRFTEAEGLRDSILIDMNNGTGWPFGGPFVPIDQAAAKLVVTDTIVSGKLLRKQGVYIGITDEKERPYATLSRVMAYTETGQAIYLTDQAQPSGMLKWKQADKKQRYHIIAVYCSRTRQKVKRAAPGGEGYVIDHFSKQAVNNYLKRFTDAFAQTGTPYPHNFFNDSYEVYGANWTPTLFEEFKRRRGYALEEHLPELLGEKSDSANQVLADYRETLSDLLLDNFTHTWVDWAHSHQVQIRNQAHGSPANLIDVYAAVDVPEIEGFGLSDFGIKGLRTDSGFTKKNYSDVSMLKYASSAAHITGKPFTSSETFTWLTEHFRTSLSQMKPDLDLMFTCGVNHVFFHGTCYSPKNDPWPGWKFYASVDMSPTNSIWRDAPALMQYIQRSQSFLQMGQPDNDFLVYLPVRDMWAQRKGKGPGSLLMQFDIHSMDRKAPDFIRNILNIDRAGFDCDYISEQYLFSTSYKEGMLQTAAGTRYHALVIPGDCRMTDACRKHIDDLREAGACIIHTTDAHSLMEAAPQELMRSKYGLRAIRRRNDTGHHYFIANLTPNDVNARMPLAVTYQDARWFNPMTGEIMAADYNADGMLIHLRSGESMILQTYDQPLTTTAARRLYPMTVNAKMSVNKMSVNAKTENKMSVQKKLSGKWQFNFMESAPTVNGSLTLDSLSTWEKLPLDSASITMGTGVYTTTVRLTRTEANQLWAINLGDVRESARVYINGKYIGCAWAVPFVLPCGNTLHAGENQVRIEVTNLPANRIAYLDRNHVKWRKFNEINIVDLNYKKSTYENWAPVKSGLNSAVYLYKLQ